MIASTRTHQPVRTPATGSSATNAAQDVAPPNDGDSHALHAESTALTNLRNNVLYLYSPATASPSALPSRLRTRALLRSLHYFGVLVFWRLYRWAKYALVGSIVAAVGSVAVAGSLASGVGFFIAPTGIFASIAVGTAWGVGKWFWRRLWRRRVQKERGEDVRTSATTIQERYAREPDLQAVPW